MRPANKKESPVTEAEMAALRAIRDYIKRFSIAPSFEEIAAAVDRKKSTIRHTLRRLIDKGLITKDQRRRSLALTDEGHVASRRKLRRK
jgi:predicted transcriptional regulator